MADTGNEHRPEHEELVALYALGVLDGEDLERLEAHLASGCARCRRELAQRRGEVAALAEAADEEMPPAGAREALLERIASAAPRGASDTPSRPLHFPAASADGPGAPTAAHGAARGRLGWLAVAAALVVVALAWGLAAQRSLRDEIERLEARNRALQEEVDRGSAELESVRTRLASTRAVLRTTAAAPEAVLAGLDAASGARARVYRDPRRGEVLLVVDRLPSASQGRVYELWGIVGGKPLPAGVFDTGPDGDGYLITALPDAADATVDVWAVTEEPAGGVPQPTGTMVLKS